MPIALHKEVPFDARAYRDFTHELDRYEKIRRLRPHFGEPFWFKALAYTDCRHRARSLSHYELDRDIDSHRAPSCNYVERFIGDSGAPKMNGRPLKLLCGR